MSSSLSVPEGTTDYHPNDTDDIPPHALNINRSFEFPPRSSSSSVVSDYTPPPLPAFSFNPGNVNASHAPPTSTSIASRPMGHRRRPSELIGGEGPPSPRILSTSPGHTDREQTTLPPAALSTAPRPPGRRGHAHRRSQAMSSMDLTALTLSGPSCSSTAPLQIGSAPSTPADHNYGFQNHMIRPLSRSAVDLMPQPSAPVSPVNNSGLLRPDFPFVDRPRPVSMISTETSSSMSTVRANHSRVSSATPSSANLEGSSSQETIKGRPKTADPSLLISKLSKPSEHFGEMSFLRRSSVGKGSLAVGRHSSESVDSLERKPSKDKHSSKKDKKKKKKKAKKNADSGSLEEHKTSSDVNHAELPADPTQENLAERWDSASSYNSRSGAENSQTRKADTHTKKQKKVRTWAGAIFPLKNKRTHAKRPLSRRSPTPPPILTRSNSNLESIEVDFDEDNTVIIRTPTNPNMPRQAAEETEDSDKTFENAWKPRSFYEQRLENDAFSPVIDLDAALGPFNTPEMSAGKIAGSAFSQATKRMYSGGRRGEFIGPEMRYHRRAESAPEMPPFERSALAGFPRLGSDEAMANVDVFYEEEEDAFLAEHQDPAAEDKGFSDVAQGDVEIASVIEEESEDEILPSSSETLQAVGRANPASSSIRAEEDGGLGIQVDNDAALEDGPGDAVSEAAGLQEKDHKMRPRSQMQNKSIAEESDPWAHARVPFHAAHSPELSPRMMPIEKRPCSSPLDLNSGLSQLTLPSRQASSSAFPSPDPSNMSFDGPRSATASSMTDHTMFNHSLHDQRQSSFEDNPSLSSAGSFRMNSRKRFSSSFYPNSSAERPESVHARPPRSAHSNSTKRSSLVSLSRLMGGSYGEKSKLSHEEKPPEEESDKGRRKSNRVSRLLFWKSKDKHTGT